MHDPSCFCTLYLERLTDFFSISKPVTWGCTRQSGSTKWFCSGTLQSSAILRVFSRVGRFWKDGSKHSQTAFYIVWDPYNPVGHQCLCSIWNGPQTPCNPRICLHICSQDQFSCSHEAKINQTTWIGEDPGIIIILGLSCPSSVNH